MSQVTEQDLTISDLPRWSPIWTFWFVGYFLLLSAITTMAYLRILDVGWLLSFVHSDVVAHILLVGMAGYLLHRALARRCWSLWGLALPIGPLIFTAISIFEESMQGLSPNRTFSWLDMFGSVLGVWLFFALDWLDRKRHSSH